jgi:hypothetical protein
MFTASISITTPESPDGLADAEAGGDPDGLGDALGDAGAEPLGSAEPLGDTLGIGVADGAGAYVQPGAGAEHALSVRAARTTDRKRSERIGAGDLRVGADGRGRVFRRCYRVGGRPVGMVPATQEGAGTIVRIAPGSRRG